tara:strand:- start:883 stop:1116 length:234 start_codon:yes stop_codon:yes gene_type:complete
MLVASNRKAPPFEREDLRARLKAGYLNDRERFVIESFFGVNRNKLPLSDIAEELGVTESRVAAIKIAAVKRLKRLWD